MIRVFPRRTNWTPTDALAFVGDPQLYRPPTQPVKISVTFTWDITEGQRLAKTWSDYYPDVQMGGPALGDPGGEFVPGQFLKEGVVITSRGCNRSCPWCFVPAKEGKIRELPIKDGWIVQDNNVLACSRSHIENVFKMLRHQKNAVTFSGGIDAILFQAWHRDLLDSIRLKEIWFACDSPAALPRLERVATLLDGIPQNKRRCYVMVGFKNESMADAEHRLQQVYEMGFLPFCQLYKGPGEQVYDVDWKALSRRWSRPAIYKVLQKLRLKGIQKEMNL